MVKFKKLFYSSYTLVTFNVEKERKSEKKAEKLGINGRLIDVSQQQSGALEMFF